MVTSRDVAKRAQVSQSTVSRVLKQPWMASEETREKVLRAIDELAYRPNPNAQAMRGTRTNSIGVVVGRITNPFYPELLEAISLALESQQQRMILWNTGTAGEVAAVAGVRDRIVDGLIFTTASRTSKALEQAIISKAPTVLLNRSLDGVPCDQLTSDNVAGAGIVADHFVGLGHRVVAVLGGDQDVSTGRERRLGFLEALKRHGVAVEPEHDRLSDFTHDAGYALGMDLLKGPNPPTAIFCVNDLLAFGALDACRDRGVRVPEDVSIVGYDDTELAGWASFNLTTVRQSTSVMARDAVDVLLRRLSDPSRPFEHRRFAAELVVRGTTGPPSS